MSTSLKSASFIYSLTITLFPLQSYEYLRLLYSCYTNSPLYCLFGGGTEMRFCSRRARCSRPNLSISIFDSVWPISSFMLIILSIGCSYSLSCDPKEMLERFVEKEWLNPRATPEDLYPQQKNKTFMEEVKRTLQDDSLYCVLRYLDAHRKAYQIKQSNDVARDTLDGWIITHKGNCGHCSSLQDLAVYLSKDLTTTVRSCGLKFFYSQHKQLKCIQGLGFTHNCALTWLYNTLNTKKQCGLVCLYSYLTNQPFVVNEHLNRCLQCDEDRSGPIFKFMSGRTRRNSGIHSEIQRDERQIYEMEHCQG